MQRNNCTGTNISQAANPALRLAVFPVCSSLPHGLVFRSFRCFGSLALFFRRIHRLPAVLRAAVAGCGVIAAIVEVVVVEKFLACGDIAQRLDPYPAIHLVGLTVGVAAVIEKHGDAVTIDHVGAIANSEEIGGRRILVALVGHFFRDTRASVLDDARAFGNGSGGVTTGSVNGGRSDD